MRVSGTPRELAKLGDAIVNFAVSAALTLREGRPQGVKVPDRLLREVSKRVGVPKLGSLEPEDVLEAAAAYAWLRGCSVEDMVRVTLKGMEGGSVEGGLVELARHLATYVRELQQLAGEW